MAGGNVIGTGAIVLTASADQALAGFDKVSKGAEKWANATAKHVDKVDTKVKQSGSNIAKGSGGAGGGILGALIGGAGKGGSALGGIIGGLGGVLGGALGGPLGAL